MAETIYLASTNAKKLAELEAMFAETGTKWSFVLPPHPLDVAETGTTFAANARLKAEAGAIAFGAPCLADDSGLVVEALDGRPGVYSARYAPSDSERVAKLLAEMQHIPDGRRTAAFACAIALVWPDGRAIDVEGRCPGVITRAAAGSGGFGYDPIFVPDGSDQTFAELSATAKNAISHRGKAVLALRRHLIDLC